MQALREPNSISSVAIDSATMDQIESFLKECQLTNLTELDLSRGPHIRTSPEEKIRLANLLSIYLPKLNLKTLHLNNWHLENFVSNAALDVRFSAAKTPEAHAALLANTDFDEDTLKTVWGELLEELDPTLLVFGEEGGPLVLIDSPVSMQALFDALKEKPEFQALSFTGLYFTQRAWETLQKNLVSIDFLQFLNCHLSPSMIKDLTHVSTLSISGNAELGEREAFCRAIFDVIQQNPNLSCLFLEDNLLVDADLKIIFPPGSHKQLTTLSLQHNCISAKGQRYLKDEWQTGSYKRNRTEQSPCQINLDSNPTDSPNVILREEFRKKLSRIPPMTEEIILYYQIRTALLTPPEKELYFRELLSSSFQIVDVPADGNCLFYACSDAPQKLRQSTVNYMLSHSDEFAPHMEDDITLEAHAAVMRQNGTWGGNVEIAAISKVLNCPVAVFCKEYPLGVKEGKLVPGDNNIFNREADPLKTIYLYRKNESHFLRLFPSSSLSPMMHTLQIKGGDV